MAVTTFAAIDISSYEITMKIFEFSKKGGFRTVDDIRYRLNLGVGVYSGGTMEVDKVDTICEVLNDFKDVYKRQVLGEQSLLKNGTWAFLGNGNSDKASERYLFWTSFDTNKVGVGKKIPILIQRGDGKYYVSKSLTAERKKGNVTYVAISDHLFNKWGYERVITAGEMCIRDRALPTTVRASAWWKYWRRMETD